MDDHSGTSDRRRLTPTTEAGRAWRRAEQLSEKLAETGDTPVSFFVKGTIGCLVLLGIGVAIVWAVISVVRQLS